MTGGWKPLDAMARALGEVWLFLPSASFKADEHGRVTDVVHHVVIGRWDGHWVDRAGTPVYPSLWHDADVAGAAPQEPELA